jgi:hypothetical protein
MRRYVAFVLLAAFTQACTTPGTGPNGPPPPPGTPQTTPVALPPSPSDSGKPRVLIDASRDGGVWWFPQVAPFDAAAGHQGKLLADEIRSLGYVVDELPRPFLITAEVLERYALVVRAHAFTTYSGAEISAYTDYVAGGGKLLLLADHMHYAASDDMAQAFGIGFAGITRGGNLLNTFAPHSVTAGVAPLVYRVGSGIVSHPAAARIVGWLSSDTYLDLNGNGAFDPGEPTAPAALGVMPFGSGRIVFCGDTNLWQRIPQPLLANVLAWLSEG